MIRIFNTSSANIESELYVSIRDLKKERMENSDSTDDFIDSLKKKINDKIDGVVSSTKKVQKNIEEKRLEIKALEKTIAENEIDLSGIKSLTRV